MFFLLLFALEYSCWTSTLFVELLGLLLLEETDVLADWLDELLGALGTTTCSSESDMKANCTTTHRAGYPDRSQ